MEKQTENPQGCPEGSIVQQRLTWQLAERDDQRVAQGLYAGEEIEEMHERKSKQVYLMSFLCFWNKWA